MCSKIELYDGDTRIHKINILGMYRSNEKYLEYLLKMLNTFEDKYKVEFKYFFIENNSKDNTRESLRSFVKQKTNSKLMLFNLKNDYKNIGDGRNFNRISNLAKIRNKLVDNAVPFPEDEWCLIIDSNIYFKDDILENVFKQCPSPTTDNIGMMCMYTQQLMIPEIHKTNTEKPILVNHFYDTYSFFDKSNKTFYPMCAFEKCRVCSSKEMETQRERVPKEQPIVDISSAFGGFVFIKGSILNDKRIRWDTMCYDIEKDQSLCEHVIFCERLKTITEKRIVMLQNVDSLYRTI